MGYALTICERPQHILEPHTVHSIYHSQLRELVEARTPSLSAAETAAEAVRLARTVKPVYVHFPWRGIVLETVPAAEFYELKTNRNQYLLTRAEQSQLYNASVSMAGMSVGSALLYGLVGSGFGCRFTIADGDTFSTTNLNRVQATVLDVDQLKVEIAAQRAFEMNPFIEIHAMAKRLTDADVDTFFFNGKARVIFEEVDDYRMKIVLRERAKAAGIAFVMLTNLVDSVSIDIERYDTEPDTKPFLGLADDALLARIKAGEMNREIMKDFSVRLVDKALLTDRAYASVDAIGKDLVGRPQLYGTVALDGGLAPYIYRRILLGDPHLRSGRYTLSLSAVMGRPHV